MNILKIIKGLVGPEKIYTNEAPTLSPTLIGAPTPKAKATRGPVDGWYKYKGPSGISRFSVGERYYIRRAEESWIAGAYRVYEQVPNEEILYSYIDEIHVAKTTYMTDCWEFIKE